MSLFTATCNTYSESLRKWDSLLLDSATVLLFLYGSNTRAKLFQVVRPPLRDESNWCRILFSTYHVQIVNDT